MLSGPVDRHGTGNSPGALKYTYAQHTTPHHKTPIEIDLSDVDMERGFRKVSA